MAVFQDDCPHCGTTSVAFTIIREHRAFKESASIWDTLAVCGQCSRSVLATFLTSGPEPDRILESNSWADIHDTQLSPEPLDTGAPKYSPKNVARFYSQGMENLIKNWDAAGVMFRKALDVGLKVKFSNDTKGSLYERIRGAADRHDLTPELADWAHKIRLDGNDAAHDEDPFSEEEAKELQVFTELVFRYLFTLPGMMQEARGAESSEDGQLVDET